MPPPKYSTYGCGDYADGKCRFMRWEKAVKLQSNIHDPDADVCTRKCRKQLKRNFDYEPSRGPIETVSMAMYCGSEQLLFVLLLEYKRRKLFDVYHPNDLGWNMEVDGKKIDADEGKQQSKYGHSVTFRSRRESNLSWEKKFDALRTYFQVSLELADEYRKQILENISTFFNSCWYSTSRTEWSMKEAKRLSPEEYGDVLLSEMIDQKHQTCKEPLPITVYPQTHHQPDHNTKRNELSKYGTIFQYWRQLKFLYQEGKKFDAVFHEAICDGFAMDEKYDAGAWTHFPSRFEQLSVKQMESLYEVYTPSIIALRMRWIRKLLGTVSVCETKQVDEMMHKILQGKITAKEHDEFVLRKREQWAADRVLTYLRVHPTHRVLLIYGAGHDFRPYFAHSGFRMCSVRPTAIEPLPFI